MVLTTCDVHKILDDDVEPRTCKYCAICKKWICQECMYSPRRLKAYLKYKGITPESFREALKRMGIG